MLLRREQAYVPDQWVACILFMTQGYVCDRGLLSLCKCQTRSVPQGCEESVSFFPHQQIDSCKHGFDCVILCSALCLFFQASRQTESIKFPELSWHLLIASRRDYWYTFWIISFCWLQALSETTAMRTLSGSTLTFTVFVSPSLHTGVCYQRQLLILTEIVCVPPFCCQILNYSHKKGGKSNLYSIKLKPEV